MSWLYSRALVEEYSAATCSAGAQSALSSSSPTPQAFLPSDKMTAFSRPSRSGMTFAPLTDGLGKALLTWFLADSHVRTYQLPGMAPELTESVPAFGEKWHESSVRYDRDSSSWKTHRCLWEEDLPWSSVALPNWGMTLDGVLWEPPTLGRPISAIEYGLWPTPVASDTSMRSKPYAQGGTPLSLAVGRTLWPTPTVRGNHNQPGASKTAGWGLSSAVKLWRTPNASDANKWSKQTMEERQRKGSQIRLNTQVDPTGQNAGQLNPTWVEWLMGWPLEWTALKPLEMARFHEWQQQHSLTSLKAGSEAA